MTIWGALSRPAVQVDLEARTSVPQHRQRTRARAPVHIAT